MKRDAHTHTKGQRLLAGGTGLGVKRRQSESKISTCKTENTLIKTQIQPFNFFPS